MTHFDTSQDNITPLSMIDEQLVRNDANLASYYDYFVEASRCPVTLMPVIPGEKIRLQEGVFTVLSNFELELEHFDLKIIQHCSTVDFKTTIYQCRLTHKKLTTVYHHNLRLFRWLPDDEDNLWTFLSENYIGEIKILTQNNQCNGKIHAGVDDMGLTRDEYTSILIPEICEDCCLPAFKLEN